MLDNELEKPLTPAWWPLNWLKLLYVAWFDQAWYWRNVRPRLRGRRQGWSYLLQAAAAVLLLNLALDAGAYLFFQTTGLSAGWGFEAELTLFILPLGVLLALLVLDVLLGSLADALADMACFGPLMWLMTSVYWLAQGYIPLSRPVIVAAAIGTGLLWGFTRGLAEGLKRGRGLDWADFWKRGQFLDLLIIGFVLARPRKDWVLSLLISLCAVLVNLPARAWTARQIPDPNLRQRLANPE
jgi:hypothetical protein